MQHDPPMFQGSDRHEPCPRHLPSRLRWQLQVVAYSWLSPVALRSEPERHWWLMQFLSMKEQQSRGAYWWSVDDGSEPLNGLPMVWLCWGPAGCASAGCRGAQWYHIGSKCKKRAKTGEDILGVTWCVRNRLKWSIPAKLCTCHRGNMVTNEGISGYKPKYLDYLVISCDILWYLVISCAWFKCVHRRYRNDTNWSDGMLMIFFQAAAVGTQAAAVGAAVGPLASGWEPKSPRWGEKSPRWVRNSSWTDDKII